ncbi:MAG: tetratricopeptide repeat protein [Myxococcales bacterium]|nr:tetratricopeptide repeat protein [Myxococcales bacterium]
MANATDLELALKAVRSAPHLHPSWDEAEQAATGQDPGNGPTTIVALYREILASRPGPEVAEIVGQRAVAFCDEWFGDDPRVLEGVLLAVLEAAPDAEAPVERLSMTYTVAERWDDILGLYESLCDRSVDSLRQIRLLQEAAQLAKDVANRPEQAIGYMQRLLRLTPDDGQLRAGLERLLERHERWHDLIALWQRQLDTQTRREREKTLTRIATCWLEQVGDETQALAVARRLLSEAESDHDACAFLERIVQSKQAKRPIRDGAIELLRSHYEGSGRPRDVVRVLELAINADPAGSHLLREEAASRLAELGNDDAALEHYAQLLLALPDSSVTLERLRLVSQRSGQWERYAQAVLAAALTAKAGRRVELFTEAARTRLDLLGDAEGATALYLQTLQTPDLSEHDELTVQRRLGELYSRANKTEAQLDTLERLAQLEPGEATKRGLLGEAARLAESLGDADRALALWQRRFELDPSDTSPLDSRIYLLQAAGRFDELIESLGARAAATKNDIQRRADLMTIAKLWQHQLGDREQATAAWQRVITETGDDPEATSALGELLAKAERWGEMAELFARAASRETSRQLSEILALGDAYAHHLAQPAQALAAYRHVLALAPGNPRARAGLLALVETPATRAQATQTLVDSFQQSGEWAQLLGLLPHRLSDARDEREQLRLRREAAAMQVEYLRDAAGALANLAACLPLAPSDATLLAQVISLAHQTDAWEVAATSIENAINTFTGAVESETDAADIARLAMRLGDIYENELEQAGPAIAAYRQVLSYEKSHLGAATAIIRLAPKQHGWDHAAAALVGNAVAKDVLHPELVAGYGKAADDSNNFAAATAALETALSNGSLAADLEAKVRQQLAQWHLEGNNDTASALRCLRQAIARTPDRVELLGAIRRIEQAQPASAARLTTLRRLAELLPADLTVLGDAIAVADDIGDQAALIDLLAQQFARVAAQWRIHGTGASVPAILAQGKATPPPASNKSAARIGRRSSSPVSRFEGATQPPSPIEQLANATASRLVDALLAQGSFAQAFEQLTEAARLPFAPGVRRSLRVQAANIALGKLGDAALAADMYVSILREDPHQPEALAALGEIYAREDKHAELIAIRRHQVAESADVGERVGLRLEMAKSMGIVEGRSGRVEVLLANLEDAPGHAASMDALAELLRQRGELSRLALLFEREARKLEVLGDMKPAAGLWRHYAQIAEIDLGEPDRAIAGHRRVVALAPTADSLRSLARLQMERKQPAQALPWFESLLGTTTGPERIEVVIQLARVHADVGQPERAASVIEKALPEFNDSIELRSLLATIYRQLARWRDLAELLTGSLDLVADDQATAFAREAAEIYSQRLGEPGNAVPALLRALVQDPNDRVLRTGLAAAYRAAKQFKEARDVIGALIAEYGRRRTPDRAELHVELGRIAWAEGNQEEALTELEQAARMDVNSAAIQLELAQLAKRAGQIDRAERNYRALLLVVRRQASPDELEAVGQSEVLYELHKLAEARGEAAQSKELLQSATEAAVASNIEVRRLRRSMLAHGDRERLLQIIDRRLSMSGATGNGPLLTDKADLLIDMGRGSEALEALIAALQGSPADIDIRDRARKLAKEQGAQKLYVDSVVAISERLRRQDDPPIVSALLLSAAEALEHDAGDLRAASKLYHRVELLGIHLAEAYGGLARIAGELGDDEEQARVLDAMMQVAGPGAADPSAAQLDAMYRLAEVFASHPQRRKQSVDLLERAFTVEPRWAQVGRTLRVITDAGGDERALAFYGKVAQQAGDLDVLLDYLEKKSQTADVAGAELERAVEIAQELGRHEKVDALLARATAQAKDGKLDASQTAWAYVTSSRHALRKGDATGSFALLLAAAPLAEGAIIEKLANDIITSITVNAGGHSKGAGADVHVRVLEFLQERRPHDPDIWRPLVTLYHERGNDEALTQLLGRVMPQLTDVDERNDLRLEQARYLLARPGGYEQAITLLKEVLQDNPDHAEAATLFEATLEKSGDRDGLAAYLSQQFDDAIARGAKESTSRLAVRLASISRPHARESLFRRALAIAPADRAILHGLLEALPADADPREKAQLSERLLAVEEPAEVAVLASKVAELWRLAGDSAATKRVLETALQAAPEDRLIRTQLENWYAESGDLGGLARLHLADGKRNAKVEAAVESLRDAARIYRDSLSQLPEAIEALTLANQRAPHDATVIAELADALVAARRSPEADALLETALARPDFSPPVVAALTTTRATVLMELGRLEDALALYESAYQVAPAASYEALAAGYARARLAAASKKDAPRERELLFKEGHLHVTHHDHEGARELLTAWTGAHGDDIEALQLLRDIDVKSGNWDGVLAASAKLALVCTGSDQVEAALRTAEAAQKLGREQDAIETLQRVHEAQPGAAQLRARLRDYYTSKELFEPLAALHIVDAAHATSPAERFTNLRRAAEIYLYNVGSPEAATGPAQQALAVFPEDHALAMLLVDVLIASGKTDEAATTLEASINAHKKRTPELAALQQRMGRVCGALGDKEAQLGWLKKAFDVDRKSSEIAAELAQLATEAGDYELALKPLRAIALMENPQPVTRPMALLWEAKIENARGNRAKAELWAKKALREDPSFADAQTFLAELGA